MKIMTKPFLLMSLLLATGLAVGCGGDDEPAGDDDDDMQPDAEPVDTGCVEDEAPEVLCDIVADTTWTADKSYVLNKPIFVKNGAVLTIEPGTVVKGTGVSGQPGALVVTTAGRIEAVGTKEKPIVFTSAKTVTGRAPGDWGGIVLLGKAKINAGATESIEGFPAGDTDLIYGGMDDTHNCGTLKYVRIEFAGFVLEANNELNGLTVGGCGSQTTLDFIQIHKGNDDAVEFFGGTANLKHAVLDQGLDDGLDWDFGWTGKVQFLIVQVGNFGDSERAIEGDNHPEMFDAMPRSAPVISNATFVAVSNPVVGGFAKQGIQIRRGSAGKIHNAIIANFNDAPIDLDELSGMQANLAAPMSGAMFLTRALIFGNGKQAANWNDTEKAGTPDFNEQTFFMDGALQNTVSDVMADLKLDATAFSLGNATKGPVFSVAADSPALAANAGLPPTDAFFDQNATFIGAIGPGADADWTAGWTSFPQN